MNNKIEEKIKEMVAEVVEVDIGCIECSTDLCRDLGADSLDWIEIIVKIQKEFSVRLSDAEALECKTVEHLLNFVKKRLIS